MGDPSQASEHAVTVAALLRKRADIAFDIGKAKKAVERLRTDLVHIDAVLRMFRPDLDLAALPARLRRPVKCAYFKRGELTQRIYDAVRDGRETDSREIADRAMRDKGLDPESDPKTRQDFMRRIGLQLTEMYRNGELLRLGKGRHLRWRLAAREPDLTEIQSLRSIL